MSVLSGIIDWRRDRRRKSCTHDWRTYDQNTAKRRCSKCGQAQWLYQLPFPSETKPSLQWKNMDWDNRP